MNLRPGRSARVECVVGEADTALAMGSGDVPVLATPRIVALCEQAACDAIRDALDDGDTTVGLAVDVKHLAPTAIGCRVVAEARLESVDGRKATFACRVLQDDTEVARGRHVRVVVNRVQFLDRSGCS